jgi:hypothetical protein
MIGILVKRNQKTLNHRVTGYTGKTIETGVLER